MMPDKSEQMAIFKQIRRKLRSTHSRSDRALPWALLLAQHLRLAGHDAILQAGSANWLRAPVNHADGPTYFAIEWDSDSVVDAWFADSMDIPPSFHSWVVCQSEKPVLVDLTTGAWPTKCLEETGYPWPAERPPDFLWSEIDSLPNTCRYQADPTALRAALRLGRRFARFWPELFSAAVDIQIKRLCRSRS